MADTEALAEAPKRTRSYRDVLADIGAAAMSARENPMDYPANAALAIIEKLAGDGLDGDMVEDEAILGVSRLIFDPEEGEDVRGEADLLLRKAGLVEG